MWPSPGQRHKNILLYAGLLEKYSAQQRLSGAKPAMLYLGLNRFRTTALPLMWRDFVPLEHSLFQWRDFVPLEYSFVPVCTGLFFVCCSLDADGEPLEKRLLEAYKTRFFKVVAVDRIYRELCEKKVIDETTERCIFKSRSDDEKRGHLFYHMWDYGTLDTLKVFCDVITSEEYNGIAAMQDLGREMKRALEQG